MAIILPFILSVILMTLSGAVAVRQVVHDENFQPNYILRVSQKDIPIACRTRFTAVVNGCMSLANSYHQKHWHGLSQSAAPYSDGTPQASQWPIKAGHFFDYEIRPQPGEAGTYFYHSHVGFQAVSVAGPLIVEEQSQQVPYLYDEEKILFLSELFNKTDDVLVDGLTRPYTKFIWSGEAETILVNGKSYLSLNSTESTAPQPWSKPDPAVMSPCIPEIIEVEPGKTYRIRTVGGTGLSMVSFAFEDHQNLSVIAADAHYTQPANTDHILIGSGQRYDFLLQTKTESELQSLGKSMFWIQLEPRYRSINFTSYALLSYKTDLKFNNTVPASPPVKAPLVLTNNVQDWLEYTLQPLEHNDFPSSEEVTRQVFLTSAQLVAQSGRFWSINNRTWTEFNQHRDGTPYNIRNTSGDVPYLVNIYKEGERAIPDYETAVQEHGGWDPNMNVYVAEVGEVIDIILINESNGLYGALDPHPWHIHGAHVYDLGSGPGTYNAAENEKKLEGYNPVLRDTTWLYKYTTTDDVHSNKNYTNQGWRAWRLRVNDAGVWMVHCHTLQHMVMGMQSVWIMGNTSQMTHGTSPDLVSGYLTYGGNAYGNSSYNPLVNHYFD